MSAPKDAIAKYVVIVEYDQWEHSFTLFIQKKAAKAYAREQTKNGYVTLAKIIDYNE